MSLSAHTLATHLRALDVTLDALDYRVAIVKAQDYPDPGRPCGWLSLHGAGLSGSGENVAWTEAAHADDANALRIYAQTLCPITASVAQLVDDLGNRFSPYARFAFESALVDLALKQQGHSLVSVDRVNLSLPKRVSLRYRVSFAACPDPVALMQRLERYYERPHFKVDVHPQWSAQVVAQLGASRLVSTLDFKAQAMGTAFVQRLRVHVPDAIFEDVADAPYPSGPLAWDKCILSPNDIDARVAPGVMFNLKGPRLGGLFALLAAIDRCQQHDAPFYMGGMFELGAGRRQAQQLAALMCADAPNDLAPIPHEAQVWSKAPAQLQISFDKPGF